MKGGKLAAVTLVLLKIHVGLSNRIRLVKLSPAYSWKNHMCKYVHVYYGDVLKHPFVNLD